MHAKIYLCVDRLVLFLVEIFGLMVKMPTYVVTRMVCDKTCVK